jgi:uncharacterized protein (TIGR02284 family)
MEHQAYGDDSVNKLTNAETVIEKLSDVIALDYDAIAAYQAAIDRLEDPTYKAQLQEFKADHQRHVDELGNAVRREGGNPPEGGDAMKILTKGQVVIAGLMGDEAILKAMKKNEDQTNSKYEEEVNEGYPPPIHALLQHGLADERRHRAWLEATISKLS